MLWFLVVAYGPVQCHFDAAELGSVHRGLALRAEMSAVGDDGITVVDVDGSCTNVAFEATAVGVYQGGLTSFLGPLLFDYRFMGCYCSLRGFNETRDTSLLGW